MLCPCTTLLVGKDIDYRWNTSEAVLFIGDATAVAKVAKVRQNCASLRHVLQVGKVAGDAGAGIIPFDEATSTIPPDGHFKTPSSMRPSTPALIFFTSGMTGLPKMVLHTQISYPLDHVLTGLHWLQLAPQSTY